MPTMTFPGRVVNNNETDQAVVRAIQSRLNELGCGPIAVDGEFGANTKNAVKLFQARFPDTDGVPLTIDGEVGPITWAALFGAPSVPPVTAAAGPLLAQMLAVAVSQIGTMEDPLGSNRGPEVDEYLRVAGLDPAADSFPWCAAFVYWCFDEAARALGRSNPVVKTAGVLDHWNKAGQRSIPRLLSSTAINNPSLVQPGLIFIIDTDAPGGAGHTGLVESVTGGKLVTIEGNTNTGGAREGIGVFRREGRKVAGINKGFIDYSRL